jgi:protein-S-isoprenylcysteine O-methyltransferase Ste14
MALVDEFQEQGQWLFRWRSFLPLVLTPLVGIAITQSYHDAETPFAERWDMVCLAVSFLGLFVRVITVGYVPERTSGRNTKRQVADTINTTGMYSMVRHPLYLGNYLIGLGISMVQFQLWLPITYTFMFWIYYERIMFAEEAFLTAKFGDAYRTWAAATPAFWPRFRQWHKPALPFSWRSVLRREYSGLMMVILCHAGQELFELLMKDHRIVWEYFWASLLFGGIATYFVLRWLNRSTKLLEVPGR